MSVDHGLIRATERSHYLMQLASYFTELTDKPEVRFAFTDRLTDIWYNQAYDVCCDQARFPSVLESVCQWATSRNRTPCIYTSPASSPLNIDQQLDEGGFAVFEEEAWMFLDLQKAAPDGTGRDDLAIVSIDQANFELFADVYRRALPGPEVEAYIGATRDGLLSKAPVIGLWYFVALLKGNPAGMITLVNIGDYAGVYAVATLPDYRGQGVARALSGQVAACAARLHSKHVFLQTLHGGEAERVFEKLGYRTRYVRKGYTTKAAVQGLQHG